MAFPSVEVDRANYLTELDRKLIESISVGHNQISQLVLLQRDISGKWILNPMQRDSDGVFRVLSLKDTYKQVGLYGLTVNDEPWLSMRFLKADLTFQAEKYTEDTKFTEVKAIGIEKTKRWTNRPGPLSDIYPLNARVYNFGKFIDRISGGSFQAYVIDFTGGADLEEHHQVRAAEWMIKQLKNQTVELAAGVK
ncbi:MAG: hypothetical protein V1810_02200 [Candidatus Beckwithbacteria bacterium]